MIASVFTMSGNQCPRDLSLSRSSASHATRAVSLRRRDRSTAFRDAYAEARSAWPDVPLTYQQFAAYLSRLSYGDELLPHAAELYLCAACAAGEQNAYLAIEKSYFPKLRATIYQVVKDTQAVGDVLQEVRSRLFVGHPPKIATYRGSGPLFSWLRSVAVRASSDYLRTATAHRKRVRKLTHEQSNNPANQPTWMGSTDERPSPSERLRHCEQAWRSAVHSLDSMDRQLLHHYFVSGLSIDALGPLYSVHRATIARRIRRITDRVRARVRANLASHYRGWSARDLDALALGVCGDLDICASLGQHG